MQRLGRLLVTLAALLVCGPPLPAQEVRSWDLEPGTTLALVEDSRVPLVELWIEFPVGFWSPWAAGHDLVEAFEIQSYDPDARLRGRADELAAELTIGVDRLSSGIHATCLREDLAQVLELISDVISNRDLDERELRRWKRAATIEWKASAKLPQFVLSQTTARIFFAPDDPRRRPYEKPRPLTTASSKLLPARDAVLRSPDRVIAFAGDLDADEARRMAEGLLPQVADAGLAGRDPELQPIAAADARPPEAIASVGRINQAFFYFCRESMTYEDPRYPAFLIADHVLGGHFHSRLYRALRHEGGETYAAYTVGRGDLFQQAYGLTTFTRADNADATEAKLRRLLVEFREQGITEQERQDAASHFLGRRAFSRQSPGQIMRRYLFERRNGLPQGFYDRLIDRAAGVPLAEVNALIAEFYDPEKFTMVQVRPE